MRRDAVKYGGELQNALQGIIESQATPSYRSFEALINYRHDKRVGGLSNRLGYRNYLDVAYQPDAMQFTNYPNCGNTLVIASPTKIEVLPPFDLETGSANSSLIDITSANIANNTLGSLPGTNVINLGTPIDGRW